MTHEAALQVTGSGYPAGKEYLLYRVAELVNEAHEWDMFATSVTLAEWTSLSPSTVRGYLRSFVADGWLEVIAKSEGPGKATRYRWVHVPEKGVGPATGNEKGVGPATDSVAPATGRGGSTSLLLIEEELKQHTREFEIDSEPKGNETEKGQDREQTSTDPVTAEFAKLWEVYPNRRNRKGAAKAYARRRRDGDLTCVDAQLAVAAYAAHPDATKDGGQYAMHAATFFGPSHRWEDYLTGDAMTASGPKTAEEAALDAIQESYRAAGDELERGFAEADAARAASQEGLGL